MRLNAIFVSEHGTDTDLDVRFGNTIDPRSNLVVHNLYGSSKVIPHSALADLGTLVLDLQNAGVRLFTYLVTLGAALGAAAKAHIPVLVPDRPNSLGGGLVGRPVSDMADRSLTNYMPSPLLHGMAIGELTRLLSGKLCIDVALHVMVMEQYDCVMHFTDTGLGWVPPPPNLRDLSILE